MKKIHEKYLKLIDTKSDIRAALIKYAALNQKNVLLFSLEYETGFKSYNGNIMYDVPLFNIPLSEVSIKVLNSFLLEFDEYEITESFKRRCDELYSLLVMDIGEDYIIINDNLFI